MRQHVKMPGVQRWAKCETPYVRVLGLAGAWISQAALVFPNVFCFRRYMTQFSRPLCFPAGFTVLLTKSFEQFDMVVDGAGFS